MFFISSYGLFCRGLSILGKSSVFCTFVWWGWGVRGYQFRGNNALFYTSQRFSLDHSKLLRPEDCCIMLAQMT